MVQGNPDTIYDFLLNADDVFPIELGRLDFEDDKTVQRDSEGRIINNSDNRQLYRENGLDNVIETVRSFNLGSRQGSSISWGIRDNEDNLFAETVFRPIAEEFYVNLPDVYGPDAAEILIQNSGRAEECMEEILDPGEDPSSPFIGGLSKEDRETLTKCYFDRVFQAIAVRGLVQTFPVRSEPEGGTPIPVFNILPLNSPNGFSQVFVSTLLPAENADIFENFNFSVSDLDSQNRFVWTTTPDEDLEENLGSVFNPKATANENVSEENINFNFPDTFTRGSTGAVLIEAKLDSDGAVLPDFNVVVDAGQGNLNVVEKLPVEWGINAYVDDTVDEIPVHDFDTGPFELDVDEEASFSTITIDNEEQSFTIEGPVDPISDPEELVNFFDDELGSDYVTFEVKESSDVVVAKGDAFSFQFISPFSVVEDSKDLVDVVINLQLYVPGEGINNISSPTVSLLDANGEILRDAPFFNIEGEDDWKFVSREVATPPQEIDNIGIEARRFDPELGVEDAPDPIIDKALNGDYQGFGARALNYSQGNRQEVEEGESLLGDLYRFFKDYVETNYRVIHVGLSDSVPTTPIASPPQPLAIELDRYDD